MGAGGYLGFVRTVFYRLVGFVAALLLLCLAVGLLHELRSQLWQLPLVRRLTRRNSSTRRRSSSAGSRRGGGGIGHGDAMGFGAKHNLKEKIQKVMKVNRMVSTLRNFSEARSPGDTHSAQGSAPQPGSTGGSPEGSVDGDEFAEVEPAVSPKRLSSAKALVTKSSVGSMSEGRKGRRAFNKRPKKNFASRPGRLKEYIQMQTVSGYSSDDEGDSVALGENDLDGEEEVKDEALAPPLSPPILHSSSPGKSDRMGMLSVKQQIEHVVIIVVYSGFTICTVLCLLLSTSCASIKEDEERNRDFSSVVQKCSSHGRALEFEMNKRECALFLETNFIRQGTRTMKILLCIQSDGILPFFPEVFREAIYSTMEFMHVKGIFGAMLKGIFELKSFSLDIFDHISGIFSGANREDNLSDEDIVDLEMTVILLALSAVVATGSIALVFLRSSTFSVLISTTTSQSNEEEEGEENMEAEGSGTLKKHESEESSSEGKPSRSEDTSTENQVDLVDEAFEDTDEIDVGIYPDETKTPVALSWNALSRDVSMDLFLASTFIGNTSSARQVLQKNASSPPSIRSNVPKSNSDNPPFLQEQQIQSDRSLFSEPVNDHIKGAHLQHQHISLPAETAEGLAAKRGNAERERFEKFRDRLQDVMGNVASTLNVEHSGPLFDKHRQSIQEMEERMRLRRSHLL